MLHSVPEEGQQVEQQLQTGEPPSNICSWKVLLLGDILHCTTVPGECQRSGSQTLGGQEHQDNMLVAIMTDIHVASEWMLLVISCGFKIGCGKRSKCRKAGLYCTTMCSWCFGQICTNSCPPDGDYEQRFNVITTSSHQCEQPCLCHVCSVTVWHSRAYNHKIWAIHSS